MGCLRISKVASPGEGDAAYDQQQLVKNGTVDSMGRVPNKRSTGKWLGCFPMLVIQIALTVVFFGIVSNLVNYMTGVLHQGVAKSARDVNNWQGTLFTSSVLGAFLSDAYWGRYKTLAYSFILYFLGLSCLTISASLKSLRPSSCSPGNLQCPQPTAPQSAFFYLSLYAISISAGSMTASIMSFGADQFDDSDDVERKQKSSFFNWLLWSIHIGGFMAVTGLVYVEDHLGFGWGFGILLVVISVAMLTFFVQTPKYRYREPEGSPLTKVAQVLVAAFRKRSLSPPKDFDKLHEEDRAPKGKRHLLHTLQFLFLDKAALKRHEEVEAAGPWELSTVTRVEEVKLIVRMLPIWFATLWFTTAPSQTATFFLRQAMAMDNHLGSFKVPQASMLLFNNLGVLLFIPLYDYLLVPAMRKLTKNERGITLLQRIGIGIGISIVALVIAALLEQRRKNVEKLMSIFWLVPQYLVLGVAEGMANTGLIEFFHDQSPDMMHSLGTSFALLNIGVGSFLSSVLVTSVNKAAPSWLQNDVNRGHVDYFYWLLAGISVVNIAFYIPLAHWYSYKKPDAYTDPIEE